MLIWVFPSLLSLVVVERECMSSLLLLNRVINIQVDRLLVDLPSGIRVETQNLPFALARPLPLLHDDPIHERVCL